MYKLAPRFHKLPGLIEMDLSHRCRPFSSCGRRERERNIDKHGHAFDGTGRLGRRAFGSWCSCHRCGLLACRSSTYDHVGYLHGSGVAHHKTKYLPPIQSNHLGFTAPLAAPSDPHHPSASTPPLWPLHAANRQGRCPSSHGLWRCLK